jgi:hypothetical protein
VSSETPGACKSTADCNWNEFCSGTQCKSFPAAGETCSSTCKYLTACSNGKCVDMFSIEADGACDSIEVCKTGLECRDGKCSKPVYDLLGGPGVLWGADCHPGEPGCACNQGLHNYMFVKERSVTYLNDCPDRMKGFERCMIDNGCTTENLKADSCLRRKCYWQYVSYKDYCRVDGSLVASRCGGAGSLVVFAILLVGVLLSF